MKIIENLLSLVGAGPARKAPAPTYRAIADGLVITATKAEAWLELPASNTDTMTEAEIEDEVESVIRVAGTVLRDVDCHLKIVWSGIEGDEYLSTIGDQYTTGDWKRWAEDRADYIDQLELPRRHTLLGITIAENVKHDTSAVERAAAPAFGIDQHRVKSSDLAKYAGLARKLGRQLRGSRLKAKLAPAETLAWMLSREQYRERVAVPRHGTITGANLATLTRGHVEPFADHLRVYDQHGEIVSYVAVLPIIDFPEEMGVPGEGEWLRTLSDISRINDSDSVDAGIEETVIVDASVRFRVASRSAALKEVNDANSLAREQERSAGKNNVGEVPDDVTESAEVTAELATSIKRAGMILVRSHPRLIASGATLEDLEANITAITTHYSETGITVYRAPDEQRELWLETLPGDQVRVNDLDHVQDGVGFFGSLFWGGSSMKEQEAPAIGHLTGSTPDLARFQVIKYSRRDQATTVGIIGRSGMGKTTFMQLALLEAAFAGSWCLLLDWKGDTSGVVTAARDYGLDTGLMRLGDAHSGSMDLFQSLKIEDAAVQVARQLALLAAPDQRMFAERVTLAAANAVAEQPHPSTWAVIQRMLASDDIDTRALGQHLFEMSKTTIGRAILGEPTGEPVLTTKPGLWALQMPGMALPQGHSDPATWDVSQRLAIAAMRSVTAHSLHMSSDQSLRALPKVIGIPEAHRMLAVGDGADFLDQIARMGRAFGTALMLDSQDAEGIASHEGLAEQLIAVLGFQLQTSTQQDALAGLLGMPVDDDTRRLIGHLAETDEGTEEKGHALMREGSDLARIHVDLPSERVGTLLDTNPNRTAAADEHSAQLEEALA